MVYTVQGKLIDLSRNKKRCLLLAADIVLITVCFLLAMALRLDGISFLGRADVWPNILVTLAILIPSSLLVFIRLGFYRAVIRYISSRALVTVLTGVAISSAILAIIAWSADLAVPRTVPFIYGLIALCGIGGVRLGMRAVLAGHTQRRRRRVIIYGAGASGTQLQQALSTGPEYLPVAFVDDNPNLRGLMIGGCRVHRPAELPQLITRYGAESLLLALPSIGRTARAEVLDSLKELPIRIQTIPGMADVVSGKTRISDIVDVPVEDLLGRDPVPPQRDLMNRNLRGRVVMVTGAGGSIGSELCRQILAQQPRRLVLFDVSEYNLYRVDQELQALAGEYGFPMEVVPLIGSVSNSDRVLSVLREHGVETIYHAAAYKHVPLIESNVIEGICNNVFGTRVLAEAAVAAGVTAFILVSTDKAVRPTNVMGASKRMAELICQAMAARQTATRFSIVRFGNVLGSSGSVIPLFHRQIAKGGPITVTHPGITRYFMTIPEAAQLVIQAGAMARGGDVFVLDMGEPVRIVELALRLARLSGLKPVVIPPVPVARGAGTLPTSEEAERGDIEIRFTGLRPGEKLYEELLISENAAPTEHSRIMTATEIALSPDVLDNLLDRLRQCCRTHDIRAIRALLVEARTGYLSQTSEKVPEPERFPDIDLPQTGERLGDLTGTRKNGAMPKALAP